MSHRKQHHKSGSSAKARGSATSSQRPNTVVASDGKRRYLIAGAIVVVVFAAAVAFAGNSAKTPSSASVPPEEQKYIGRFLPAGYAEPAVAEATTYGSVVKMTPVPATATTAGASVPLSDVISKKIVSFDAQKDGAPLSMLAYVKPSGKLFVGVNFCPPCQGKGQRLEVDGTLTCESCGTKRDPETQVGISGACKLYPLDEIAVAVEGDNIVVAQAAIDGWSEQPLDRKVGE